MITVHNLSSTILTSTSVRTIGDFSQRLHDVGRNKPELEIMGLKVIPCTTTFRTSMCEYGVTADVFPHNVHHSHERDSEQYEFFSTR